MPITKPRRPKSSDIDPDSDMSSPVIPGMSPAESSEFALSPEDQVDIDKINDVLKMNDLDGGKVRLMRKGPEDTTYQYLCTIPISQFDIEWIKKVHGGGDYKGTTFRSNGQHGKPLPNFSIDYKAKGSADTAASPRTVSYVDPIKQAKEIAEMVTSQNKGMDQLTILREMMSQSRTDQQAMLQLMIAQMTESSKSQVAMITETMRAMTNKPEPKGIGAEGWAAILAATTPILLKVIDRPTKEGSNMLETIELIKAVKETFADEGGKEESVMGSFFKAIGPAIGAMTGMTPQAQRTPSPQPRALPSSTSGLNQNPNQNINGRSMPAQPVPPTSADQQLITNYINMLHDAAENDSDPAPYVDMLFNHAPEQFMNRLVSTLGQDNWMQSLFGDDPRAARHQTWLEELRQLILTEHTERNKPDEPTEPIERVESDAGGRDELEQSGSQDDAVGNGTTSS